MGKIIVAGIVIAFLVAQIRRRSEIAKRISSSKMLGFSWGDAPESIASWARKMGLRYRAFEKSGSWVLFEGKFPEVIPRASYTFFIPEKRLDSIAVLLPDMGAYWYEVLLNRFRQKYGDCWDFEEGCATWIAGDLMLVLFSGRGSLLHIRYLNMGNLEDGESLDETHDGILSGIRELDGVLHKQFGDQDGSKKK